MKILKYIGYFILFSIGYSIFTMWSGAKVAKEVCDIHKPGMDMPSVESLKKKYSGFAVSVMGPYKADEQPGRKMLFVCVTATMCESKCVITYERDKVISSVYGAR